MNEQFDLFAPEPEKTAPAPLEKTAVFARQGPAPAPARREAVKDTPAPVPARSRAFLPGAELAMYIDSYFEIYGEYPIW